jgi:predicted nucleotidyltransferase component of viral defense system
MLWDEIVSRSTSIGTSKRNVFQEEMQKTVLAALSKKGHFDSIVFHGGTALRLFHGNPRFSEDIDLVLVDGISHFDLSDSMPFVRSYCQDAFPFLDSVEIRTQKETTELQSYILTSRSDNREQRIRLHIELASIPSYVNHPSILNYPPVLPAVRVEDVLEIMADKICALALRPYLKGRDLWDIYYLSREKSVKLDWGLVNKKIEDYGAKVPDMKERYVEVIERIQAQGMLVLDDELSRFLPKQVLAQYRTSFDTILDSVIELISI